MDIILVFLFNSLAPSYWEAETFRSTDPSNLSWSSAADHLFAARVAGAIVRIDPELLLAIAWHESRYKDRAVTKEPGRRVSCGPMTPVPHYGRCSENELSIMGGYLIGARHLRTWLDICRGNRWCALTAYVGGSGLVRVCATKGHSTNAFRHDACRAAGAFLQRARYISRAMKGAVL